MHIVMEVVFNKNRVVLRNEHDLGEFACKPTRLVTVGVSRQIVQQPHRAAFQRYYTTAQ